LLLFYDTTLGIQMILPSQLLCGAFAIMVSLAPPPEVIWELGNGQVQLENPFHFQDMTLRDPRLLGSGGGGAVFSFSRLSENDVVVKVSWSRSTDSVRNECAVLQIMEKQQVKGVERCFGAVEYPKDPRRALIVMEPLMEESTSSIGDLKIELQTVAVDRLVRTMLEMLSANVVTTDVQPLISQRTGEVMLIDMTEARVVKEPFSFIDLALAGSFCTEIMSLVPDSLLAHASETVVQELKAIEARGLHFPREFYDILHSQTMFSQEALEYLEAKLA
jgi:hypothetical protein